MFRSISMAWVYNWNFIIQQNANSGKPPIVESVIQGNAKFLGALSWYSPHYFFESITLFQTKDRSSDAWNPVIRVGVWIIY